MRHRNLGVLLKHAGHQAITANIIDALRCQKKTRTGIVRPAPGESDSDMLLQVQSFTWLMSLVQAAFSWRDGAKRTTEKL